MVNKYYIPKPKPELSPLTLSKVINEIIIQELDEQCPQLSTFSSEIKRALISHVFSIYKHDIEVQYKKNLEKFHINESSPVERAAKKILNGSLREEAEKYLKHFESATPGLIKDVLSNNSKTLFHDDRSSPSTEKKKVETTKHSIFSKMCVYEEEATNALTQVMYIDCLSKARDVMKQISGFSKMKEFNQLSRLLAKYLATEQEKYLDDFNAISAIQLPIEVLSPFLNQFEAEEAERLLKKKARDLADEEEKKRKAEKLKNSKQPNGEWYMNSSSWANI